MQAMKTVTLDAHTERSQMAVISPDGEILIELQVETSPEELRRVVSGIPGPKKVVLENGPLSAMIHDALVGLVSVVRDDGKVLDGESAKRLLAYLASAGEPAIVELRTGEETGVPRVVVFAAEDVITEVEKRAAS